MTNIWGFLLQTLSVSGVALLLLVIKRLLRDKVSPDVQYVFWLALAARIVLPVRAGESILFPFPVIVETLKAKAERGLSSAYGGMYDPAGSRHVLPIYSAPPQSVTDWLFVIYGVGVITVMIGYAVAYCGLRISVARAREDETEQARVDETAARYGLHTIRVRKTTRISTPFVCGLLGPVLVLPEGQEVDELVILHELLHREHHDPAKNLCWCLLRALHWCNPFVWYVINRIENDLETCNDQRVLERIEGEERRAYGKTLLAMATSRYARMPGTSSISNGRKNIARRIEAIVRFKNYPKGVLFALVCIAVVLANASLQERALAEEGAWQYPAGRNGLDYALAKSRVERCLTPAGALDTYAKGVLYKNGIYLATASPVSAQAELEAKMRGNTQEEEFYADPGFDGQDGMRICRSEGYCICNLRMTEEGVETAGRAVPVCYEATLLFVLRSDEATEEESAVSEGQAVIPETYIADRTLALPVRTYRTAGEGWVVEPAGEADVLATVFCSDTDRADYSLLEPLRRYEKTCDYGKVTLDVYSFYGVGTNSWSCRNFYRPESEDDLIVHRDAEFAYAEITQCLAYDVRGAGAGMPEEMVGIMCGQIPEGAEEPSYPQRYPTGLDNGSSSEGYMWENQELGKGGFDGVLRSGFGGSMDMDENGEFDTGYGVQICWDRKVMGEYRLEEADGER